MTAYAFCDQCEKYKLCSTVIQLGKIYCHDCKPVDKKNNESSDIHKEALRQAIFKCDAKRNDSDVSRSFCDDCRYAYGWDMPTLWKASLECDECKKLNENQENERKKSENNTFVDIDYESVKETIKNRAINHPAHYQSSKMEVIDIIEAFQLNFLTGNVIKYLLRAGKKGDALEDLKKAQWYLQRAIDGLSNE